METPESGRGRRVAFTLLRVSVSVALVTWILRKAPLHEVGAALRQADLRLVLLALALNPLGYLASVSRWRLLIRSQGGEARFGALVRAFLVGVFFNNLLPSTIGGDAVRVVETARSGVGRAQALAIVAIDRFVGLLALVLFAGFGLLASGRLMERVPSILAWVAGGAALMALAAALLFLPSRRAPELLGRLASRVASRMPGKTGEKLGKVVSAFFAFQGQGSVLAAAFAWSLVLQTAVILNGWLLARALGVTLPLSAYFLIVPLAIFIMMVPVSINAIGVRENVWAFFFAGFAVTDAAARGLAVAWLDYGLVLLQAVVGGVIWARWARGRRQQTAARRWTLEEEAAR
jgi:uncharacterized protein (TIRG00374 family)